ncbi:MAG TPA: hypothetical protein DCQ28_10125 [Bacteroidetes bacterium]|nr:hypothetical protein [Bacteroidota bacterium]
MNRLLFTTLLLLISSMNILAQVEGDVIINEIGNNGTKKSMYSGGDFVELLVLKPEGVKLAGWFLTDLSSPSGMAKETEGSIRFSDSPNSVFQKILPQGTTILVWISNKDSVAEIAKNEEVVSLNNGNTSIVVFAYNSPKHFDNHDGIINITGKDNIALLKSMDRRGAVDAIAWEATTKWEGCETTLLPKEMLENGKVAWFVPAGNALDDFKNNTDVKIWKSSENGTDATPGKTNPGVDDSGLRKK